MLELKCLTIKAVDVSWGKCVLEVFVVTSDGQELILKHSMDRVFTLEKDDRIGVDFGLWDKVRLEKGERE